MSTNSLMELLSNYRLPLSQKEKDTYTFLRQHLQEFGDELAAFLDEQKVENEFEKDIFEELKERQESVYGFSRAILNSLEAHLKGNLDANKIFEAKMNEMQDQLLSSSMNSTNGISNRFFRIRSYKDDEECNNPKDLFHIPFEKSHLAKSCRYSVPKSPHLYLSGSPVDTGLVLAWLESECPSKFYWSEFMFSDVQKKIELLDFTWSPFSNAMRAGNYRTWIIGQKPFVKELLVNYISTYPLIAACSIKVFNKNSKLEITEYAIPQMLLIWMKSQGKYRGIKYYSCSRFNDAQKYNAFNVVLSPQSDTMSTGYCPKLKCEFKVSQPELIEISNIRMLETQSVNPTKFEFIDKSC